MEQFVESESRKTVFPDRNKVLDDELTLVFAKIPQIWSSKKNADVMYQYCRDINDWILGRGLREWNHFHMPFVKYSEDNVISLDRTKCQTPIDAKNLNHLFMWQQSIDRQWKIAREIKELEVWNIEKWIPPYPLWAKALRDTFVTIKSAIWSMLEAGYHQDIKRLHKHEHIRFRAVDVVGQMNTDLDNLTWAWNEAKKKLYVRGKKDAMKSLYNMMWPQRMKMFSQLKDRDWPYLSLNTQWKKYVYTTFMRLYNIYGNDGSFKKYKVFPWNDYDALIQNINQINLENLDMSLIVEMIQYLFVSHVPVEDESPAEKSYRNDLRNRRGTFANLFIWSMYLDNMVDQEELQEFFDEFTPLLKQNLLNSDIELNHKIELSFKFRKKDYISQLLKLMRSADVQSIPDLIWAHISYYPKPDQDAEQELLKDLMSAIHLSFIDYCKVHRWRPASSMVFDSKWQLAMSDQKKADFVKEVDPTGFLKPKLRKKRLTNTGSNADYIDAKVKWEVESRKKPGENIGVEIASMPLINQNEIWLASHHFLTKQKIVETFARDRSHFSISQYMEFFDVSLRRQAALLDKRFVTIDAMDHSKKRSDLLQQREQDVMYPLSDGSYINLTQFHAISSSKRNLADHIALDQLRIEMIDSKIYPFVYAQDLDSIMVQRMEEQADIAVWVTTSRIMPTLERDFKGKILDSHLFIWSNFRNALKSSHIPAKAYIGIPVESENDVDMTSVNTLKYNMHKVSYLAMQSKKDDPVLDLKDTKVIDLRGTKKSTHQSLYRVLAA